MPRKSEPTAKEIYHLWWEYLRRSESHKKWCELVKRNPTPLPSHMERIKFFFPDLAWLDIFDKSFEEWWDSFAFGKLREVSIEDYSKAQFGLDFTMRLTKGYLEDNYPGDFSVKDFMKQFKVFFAAQELFLPVITVNVLSDMPIEEVMKDFGYKIRKKREEAVKAMEKMGKVLGGPFWKYPSWVYPSHPIRFDEVKRYLRVYDLRKEGKHWREIAADVYPRKPFDDDLKTVLIKEERKAQNIIKNVEEGIFPGKY